MSLLNTRKSAAEIGELLRGKKRLWFIGIGGVHMSSLAMLARARGYEVAGSDRVQNEHTARLREAGVPVYPCHDAAQMAGFDAVIYTLAISEDNPEYVAARRLGLPLLSRADYLGYLMQAYARRVGVAGSHGKSTVTAMLGEIFADAGRAPNVICGAEMRRFGAPFFAGGGDDFIFEACEYRDSFLSFSPTLSLILNAELDHVDYFADKEALLSSFAAFADLADVALLPAGAEDLLRATKDLRGTRLTFGLLPHADYRAENLLFSGGMGSFDLITPQGNAGRVKLLVPGAHNVCNALAAAAASCHLGVPGSAVVAGLKAFRGAVRRMEYRGIFCGARVYDDYAHHPTEIAAAISTARALGCGRLFVVFQSHTYSRTAAFFTEICAALRGADRVYITDIYAAREQKTYGMSAARLAAGVGTVACAVSSFGDAAAKLARELCSGDLLLVMGAGDIGGIFAQFSKKHFTS